MKVCHVSFSFMIGGIENLLVDILNEQSKTVDVYLIVVNKSYNQQLLNRISDKVQVLMIGRPPGSWNFFYFLQLWKRIAKIGPGIIHCHTPNLIIALLPFKKKCMYTVHNMGISLKYLNGYKKIFSISNAVKADLEKRGALSSKLIYNGINFSKFKYKTNYSLNENNGLKLVLVSRLLHEQKGQDILIRTITELLHNTEIKNISVDIIGDGPSQEYLEKLIDDLRLERYVTLLGPKDRSWLYENLMNYHALIQPSRFEGFGLTVLEAVAAGLPVIASNIDGPAEILKDIPSAFLFETENCTELALKIKEVLREYKNQHIEEKCKTALMKAELKFSVVSTANCYLNYYTC